MVPHICHLVEHAVHLGAHHAALVAEKSSHVRVAPLWAALVTCMQRFRERRDGRTAGPARDWGHGALSRPRARFVAKGQVAVQWTADGRCGHRTDGHPQDSGVQEKIVRRIRRNRVAGPTLFQNKPVAGHTCRMHSTAGGAIAAKVSVGSDLLQ